MPVLSIRIDAEGKPSPQGLLTLGPRILAVLSMSDEQAAAISSDHRPNPVQGFALVDTGASHTCIDNGFATDAGLPVVDSRKISSATEPNAVVPVYAGKLDIPSFGMVSFQAAGVEIGGQGLMMLIGRDLLQSCVLVYNGTDATVSLSR